MDITPTTTAEKILAASQENHRWECKSAILLNPDQRERFAKHLGKQVSAFANSGGGYLVFGISDDPRQLEPCLDVENKTPMKDWLSTKVNECVEYPPRTYQVHHVPFADDQSKAIYVIAIQDSPAAPHQAKEDKHYYYRIDGHTKPAPHFYVELFRNGETKAVLEITDVECLASESTSQANGIALSVQF